MVSRAGAGLVSAAGAGPAHNCMVSGAGAGLAHNCMGLTGAEKRQALSLEVADTRDGV